MIAQLVLVDVHLLAVLAIEVPGPGVALCMNAQIGGLGEPFVAVLAFVGLFTWKIDTQFLLFSSSYFTGEKKTKTYQYGMKLHAFSCSWAVKFPCMLFRYYDVLV